MLDREGYRPNVGIVLLNARNEVFWGKRIREHSWQFPQGGMKHGETPVQAMYRELREETGLAPEHVRVIGRTRDWLRYEVPDKFIKREVRGHYRGQKQIWFLLRMVGRDCDVCLRATRHPEFDAWRWHDYWIPLEAVIEFKRDVYQLALTELSRFLRPSTQFGTEAEYAENSDGVDNAGRLVPSSALAGEDAREMERAGGAGEVGEARYPCTVEPAVALAAAPLSSPLSPLPSLASAVEAPLLEPLESRRGARRMP